MTVAAAAQDSGEDKTKGTAKFSGLTAGYYLVFPEGGSTGDNARGTDAILVNVPKNGGVTEQTIKSTFPTVDKRFLPIITPTRITPRHRLAIPLPLS